MPSLVNLTGIANASLTQHTEIALFLFAGIAATLLAWNAMPRHGTPPPTQASRLA